MPARVNYLLVAMPQCVPWAYDILILFIYSGISMFVCFYQQSYNGLEFVANVISELVKQWPGTKIIRGRPRHPQSQGGVERGNQDLEDKLGMISC